MNYLRELFEGDQNQEYIHQKFIRYGRGHKNGPKAVIKKKGDKIKINASYGFENILGYIGLETSKDKIKTKGNIIAFQDIDDILELLGITPDKKRKKRDTFIYKINEEYTPETLLRAYREYPSYIFLLNLRGKDCKLKTKSSPPKPGKGMDEEFCSLQLPAEHEKKILKEICFDEQLSDIDEVRIWYRYNIKGFDIPEEYKNNSRMARLHAKRVGIVQRFISHKGMENVLTAEIRV
ncbi:MAG: hypothetical protein U9M95_05740 [Candidatus Altiarchaeota archaeon]|nr:hypothetical protein [Candidatus Altiarchaeota archaeon]